MRTREEQIAEIKERLEDLSLVRCYPDFSEIQDWLIEAEHRAEQRVRAEIGRDSERLDWFVENCAGAKYQWDEARNVAEWQVTYGVWHLSLREAIDEAREVG